jgi:hypothetical protein
MTTLPHRLRCAAIAGAFGMAACDGSHSDLRVEMAATSVTRLPPDSMATLSYRLTNHGSSSAYIAACDQNPRPGTDRLVAGSWQQYLGSACHGVGDNGPVTLAPGQVVDANWSWDVAGTYRLRVFYTDDATTPFNDHVVGPTFVIQ